MNMKRIISTVVLSLIIVANMTAQITSSSIKKEKSDSELIDLPSYLGSRATLFRSDTIYYFRIKSTNEFEDRTAMLKLGGVYSAIESLKTLEESWEDKTHLEIQGYTIFCMSDGVFTFSSSGKLEYTAGNYWFNKNTIKSGIKELEKRKKTK